MSDFEVEISGEGGNYRVAARSAAGDTSSVQVRFPFDDLALNRQLQALELALRRSAATVRRLTPVDEEPVQEFGRQLFDFAFPPELRAHLLTSYQQAAQQGTPLQVRLRVGPSELAALPWEFLYDPSEDNYLCLSTPLVRYVDVLRPRQPLTVTPPLRILAMIARPADMDSLDVDHERRRLTEALAALQAGGRVQLTWVEGQTWWDLQDALDRGDWHVFHFIGHGALDTVSGEGVLAFAAEDGGVHRVGASDLALLLAEHRSLRLVVLNSCETARAIATDRFSSTASALMRRGIPAVVAMQYEITDPAAISFARGFYSALATQHPVDQAVTRARRAIKFARRNTLEWATPVLYLRSPTGSLFDLTDVHITPGPVPPLAAQGNPAQPAEPISEQPRPVSPNTDWGESPTPRVSASPPLAASVSRLPQSPERSRSNPDAPLRLTTRLPPREPAPASKLEGSPVPAREPAALNRTEGSSLPPKAQTRHEEEACDQPPSGHVSIGVQILRGLFLFVVVLVAAVSGLFALGSLIAISSSSGAVLMFFISGSICGGSIYLIMKLRRKWNV